jgi:hypothetical protein
MDTYLIDFTAFFQAGAPTSPGTPVAMDRAWAIPSS